MSHLPLQSCLLRSVPSELREREPRAELKQICPSLPVADHRSSSEHELRGACSKVAEGARASNGSPVVGERWQCLAQRAATGLIYLGQVERELSGLET